MKGPPMFERNIAYFCAPALAGIKPGNLVSLQKADFPDVHDRISRLNETLGKVGICADILCECEKRVLLFVYRPILLESYLERADIRKLLSRYGYDPDFTLTRKIAHLKERMTEKDFPHEIGAFLGYPTEDIKGFIRYHGKGCVLCGEWKVYGDPAKAKVLFARYKKCRKALLSRVEEGKSLVQIFCAA